PESYESGLQSTQARAADDRLLRAVGRVVVGARPWNNFLSQKVGVLWIAGQFAPAIRIINHHRDDRRYHAGCDQVIESSSDVRRVDVKTTVRKYEQTVRLLIRTITVRSVNPNWAFVPEEFAGEPVTLHSSSRNLR